ncbi:unnamed protein product [Schistosoma mattheei]|uniref:Uncharacterized protein n=1 Tax=Schistosoma mattheei TaxID=31246 RepID=A0A183Q2Y2_9TREM|nr:unnamed protein product [Schistosoma mattheei]
MFFSCRYAALALVILAFTSTSDPPCSSMVLLRYVNVCTCSRDSASTLFRRSQANFELDNLEQAENDLNRLTDQDPTNFKAQVS